MLTPERAQSLWDAGINQFNISLDYLDERHDAARGIPGLSAKIFAAIPAMRARGIDNIRFNTVIKNDNLDQILPIVRARGGGSGVGRELQRLHRRQERQSRPSRRRRHDRATSTTVVRELLAFKRRRRGIITNSDYYLEQIPRYVRGEMREPCRSGIRTIHIDPTGHVKRCPDFPDRLSLARLQAVRADRLQRLLLRLSR